MQRYMLVGHVSSFDEPNNTLLNVYVDLVVFTRIAGTS